MATTPPQPGPPDRERAGTRTPAKAEKQGWSDQIKTIGGLAAVAVGVIAVTAISIVAIIEGTEIAGTIASAAGGVIATLVGAFFGVKVGTDQTRNAVEGEREQATKAAVFAAHLPKEQAEDVLGLAQSMAQGEPIGKGPDR